MDKLIEVMEKQSAEGYGGLLFFMAENRELLKSKKRFRKLKLNKELSIDK